VTPGRKKWLEKFRHPSSNNLLVSLKIKSWTCWICCSTCPTLTRIIILDMLAILFNTKSFITAIIVPFLDSYREKFEAVEGIWESTGVILQMVLACLILYKLTKSISNIVQGLMSGSPSLGAA